MGDLSGRTYTESIYKANGCVDCLALNVGDEFVLNGDSRLLWSPMLDSMMAGSYDVTKACVSHVTNMGGFLRYNTFNQDILSNVTNMYGMFADCGF